MVDGQSLQGVGAIRELRPTEDLSLMHDYELRAAFDPATIHTLKLVGTTEAAESFRLVGATLAAEPERAVDAPARSDPTPPQTREVVDKGVEGHADQRVERPSQATETTGADRPQPRKARQAGFDSDVVAAHRVVLPYGFDPTRVRELVDGIVDVRAMSAMIVAPRAAGDLTDVASTETEQRARLRAVAPTERAVG